MSTSRDDYSVDAALLNTLLRGEMTAVAIYTQVMREFEDDYVIADLQRIRDEHRRSVRELRDHIVGLGLILADDSAMVGSASLTVGAPDNAVGPAAALAVLRQGEEYEINEYEAALESDGIHPDCLRRIRAGLLPACRKHVEELNRLLGGMDH